MHPILDMKSYVYTLGVTLQRLVHRTTRQLQMV